MHALSLALRAAALLFLAGFAFSPTSTQAAAPSISTGATDGQKPSATPAAEVVVEPAPTSAEWAPEEEPTDREARGPVSAGSTRAHVHRALLPDANTRARSLEPLYRVRKSGQAHRSAP